MIKQRQERERKGLFLRQRRSLFSEGKCTKMFVNYHVIWSKSEDFVGKNLNGEKKRFSSSSKRRTTTSSGERRERGRKYLRTSFFTASKMRNDRSIEKNETFDLLGTNRLLPAEPSSGSSSLDDNLNGRVSESEPRSAC